MENFDTEWMEELKRQTETDMEYWPLECQMTPVRQAYRELRASLTPEQQAVLDEYFHLSRKMEIAMTRMAYMTGRQHGQR